MTTQTGLGVMIKALGGNEETAAAVTASLGKTITGLQCQDEALSVTFSDQSVLRVADGGQSCCEYRYMVCDDPLDQFVGATLQAIEVREAPDLTDEESDVHEVQFLVLVTDRGNVTCSNHNEHNGYYGGFWMEASLSQQP